MGCRFRPRATYVPLSWRGNPARSPSVPAAELAATSGDSTRTWNIETGHPLVTSSVPHLTFHQVVYRRDGARLATASSDFEIQVRDAADGRVLQHLIGHGYEITGLSYSPDGRRLASVGGDRLLKIWVPENGQELLSIKAHDSYIWAVAFSPDGRRIATADQQGLIKIWDGSPFDTATP